MGRKCKEYHRSGPKAGKCKRFKGTKKSTKNGRRKKSSTKRCTGRVRVKGHSRSCPKR